MKHLFNSNGNLLCPECGEAMNYDLHIAKHKCPKCGTLATQDIDPNTMTVKITRWGVMETGKDWQEQLKED